MELNENKLFIFSVTISFFLHFFIIYFVPGFKDNILETEKKYEVVKVNTRFVKLKEDVPKKIKPRNNIKKTKVKTEETGKKTVKKIPEKIKIPGPKIELNRSFIEINAVAETFINDYKLSPLPKEEEKLLMANYDFEKESFESDSINIKEDSIDKGFDDLEKSPVLIPEEEIEEDPFVSTINIGTFSEGGASETELPEGIEIDVADGIGIAQWDKSNKKITYPLEAEKNAWEGIVKVKLIVNESGKVKSVDPVKKSGYFVLDRAVEKTAKNWKIYIKKDGIQISGTVYVTRTFNIKGR